MQRKHTTTQMDERGIQFINVIISIPFGDKISNIIINPHFNYYDT